MGALYSGFFEKYFMSISQTIVEVDSLHKPSTMNLYRLYFPD